MFPLSQVLVPAMPLPLHIFESRYQRLLSDARRRPGSPAFGVVALRSGQEVGPTPEGVTPDIAEVGTLAEIVEVDTFEDETADLLVVGSRRFRIMDVITGDTPYLRARVDWVEERTGRLDPRIVTLTRRLCRDYAELLESISGRDRMRELPRDPNLLSYHVTAQLPLEPVDRQSLLEQATAADRLRLAIGLLRREISLLQATRSICVAPGVLHLAAHPN